jgi:hypothetical protein
VEDAVRTTNGPRNSGAVCAKTCGGSSLTPLGVHGVRLALRARGRIAPLVGELAGAAPGQLLGVIAEHYSLETGREEINGWLAAHDEDGPEALIDAIRDCPFRSRAAVLLSALADSLPSGEALRHSLRSDVVLGPIATNQLVSGDVIDRGDLTERELLLGWGESLLQALEIAGPDSVLGMLDDMPRTERQEMLSAMLHAGHPDETGLAELRSLVIEPLAQRDSNVHPLSGLVRRSRRQEKRPKRRKR